MCVCVQDANEQNENISNDIKFPNRFLFVSKKTEHHINDPEMNLKNRQRFVIHLIVVTIMGRAERPGSLQHMLQTPFRAHWEEPFAFIIERN